MYIFYDYAHISFGLACDFVGLVAGMVIGCVGDAGVRYITIFLISYISINICMYRLVPIIISAFVLQIQTSY